MKQFLFLAFILMVSCKSNSIIPKSSTNIKFNEDMNIDKFIIKLEAYSQNKPYPNIDN